MSSCSNWHDVMMGRCSVQYLVVHDDILLSYLCELYPILMGLERCPFQRGVRIEVFHCVCGFSTYTPLLSAPKLCVFYILCCVEAAIEASHCH